MSDASDRGDAGRETQAANLFDLRRIIGGLLLLYGAVLTILGFTENQASFDESAGLNINLIAGVGMLVLGGLFVAWALWRPPGEAPARRERPEAEG